MGVNRSKPVQIEFWRCDFVAMNAGRGGQRATLADVAREVGVSKTTASHAFSGKGWVAEPTRLAVHEAAQRLGFEIDPLAQRLSNGAEMAHLNPGWNEHRDDLFAGHLGTSNFLFSDGHVKSLRPLRTVVIGSSSYWNLNNAVDSNAEDMCRQAEARFPS